MHLANYLGERMRELAVDTCTTVEELALFINSSPPDGLLGGVSGADGMVILYAADMSAHEAGKMPLRDRLAARVAVEVVLQKAACMPGATQLLRNVEEQFEDDHGARVGWLSPPLTILARIYRKTVNALPDSTLPGDGKQYVPRYDDDGGDPSEPGLNEEQSQAIDLLIDKLLLLSKPGKSTARLK
jgi:hypothetical protein